MTPLQRYEAALPIVPLVAGGDSAPAWSPDGSSFVLLDHRPGRGLVRWTTAGAEHTLVELDVLADLFGVPVMMLVAARLSWLDEEAVAVDLGAAQVLVGPSGAARSDPLRAKVIRKHLLTGQPPITELLSPDGSWFATEQDGGIWLRSPSGDLRSLTKGEPEIVWDLEKSTWSPDSRQLFVLRHDEAGVPRLPLVDYSAVHEVVTTHAYPRSGDPFPHTTGHLLDVDGLVVDVDLGAEELFWVEPVGWTDDELLVLVSPRDNRTLSLLAVHRSTGDTRVVVEERQETFVYGIRLESFGTSVHLLGDDELVWMSERDGWRHAYRYALDGTLLERLTQGPFEVERVVGRTADGELLVLAHSDTSRPYDTHVCSVGSDGRRQLTTAHGQHDAWLSPTGRHVVVGHSALDRLPSSDLLTTMGSLVAQVNEAHDRLPVERPSVEELVLDLGDWPARHGVLVRPPGFDPTSSYPLVELVYPGPQHASHPRDYRHSANPLAQALAQLGLCVLVVDGSGTPLRGKDFQDAGHGHFGPYQSAEHAQLVRQVLATRPYLDPARVGVVGGSWGGYATLRFLLDHPDLYRVGAALYGPGDLHDHMARAIEPYMGTPASNPDGYAEADLLGRMDSLEGRLLLLHGTADANATISACLKVVSALMAADKDFDLLVVPGMEHAFVGPGAGYALRRVGRFLLDALRSPGSDEAA